MIIVDCEQGSEEWLELRRGIPTASQFDQIVTSKGVCASTITKYTNILLAAWMIGKPLDGYKSEWMERGNGLEPQAREFYEFTQDTELQTVGLVYLDERRLVSCSPDGLVGEDGGLEVKCPAPHTHIGYMLKNTLPTKYKAQVQGNLWITGRKWWDFLSYHPDLPPMMIRVERDEEFIAQLEKRVLKFVDDMLDKRAKLKPAEAAA